MRNYYCGGRGFESCKEQLISAKGTVTQSSVGSDASVPIAPLESLSIPVPTLKRTWNTGWLSNRPKKYVLSKKVEPGEHVHHIVDVRATKDTPKSKFHRKSQSNSSIIKKFHENEHLLIANHLGVHTYSSLGQRLFWNCGSTGMSEGAESKKMARSTTGSTITVHIGCSYKLDALYAESGVTTCLVKKWSIDSKNWDSVT